MTVQPRTRRHRFRTAALLLALLALGACASDQRPSPAASAVPHGSATSTHNGQVLLPGNPSYGDLGMPVAYQCPEADPAQPNCKVPR